MHSKRLSAVLQLINPDNTLAINRPLAHALGICEAIIYSTLVSKYLYYDANDMTTDDEWFYATTYDLQESTTYGEKAQKTAIKHLIELGLIETTMMGLPAKRYFRICSNADKLEELILSGSEKATAIKEEAKAKNMEKMQRRQQKKQEAKEESDGQAEADLEMTMESKTEVENASKANNYACTRPGAGTSATSFSADEISDEKSGGTCTRLGAGTRIPPEVGTSTSPGQGKTKYNNKLNIDKHNLIYQSINREKSPEQGETDEIERVKKVIAENISLNELKTCAASAKYPDEEQRMLDEVYNLICDMVAFKRDNITVNSVKLPWEYVQEQFLKLDKYMVAHVLVNLVNRDLDIQNMRAYMITALYNETMSGTLKEEAGLSDELIRSYRGDPYKNV